MGTDVLGPPGQRGLVVRTATEDVIDERATVADKDANQATPSRTVAASSLAGASPAVPRDPRLLAAEQADHEARTAAEQAAAAQAAAEEAAAKAAAAQAAALKSKEELDAARAEVQARAKAEAAALQVKLEAQNDDEAAMAARERRRASRDERLGTVAPVEEREPEVITVTKRSTDAFAGSLALLLVRLALGGWAGIVGWQSLVNQQATIDALVKVGFSDANAGMLSWGVSIGLLVAAVFLVVGLGTRIFAALMLIGVVGFLAFFRFGPFSPFLEGHFGFYGDRDVLLAVACLVLVLVGAGGASLDARIRKGRQEAKLHPDE